MKCERKYSGKYSGKFYASVIHLKRGTAQRLDDNEENDHDV
jgi:hypothetical protein